MATAQMWRECLFNEVCGWQPKEPCLLVFLPPWESLPFRLGLDASLQWREKSKQNRMSLRGLGYKKTSPLLVLSALGAPPLRKTGCLMERPTCQQPLRNWILATAMSDSSPVEPWDDHIPGNTLWDTLSQKQKSQARAAELVW